MLKDDAQFLGINLLKMVTHWSNTRDCDDRHRKKHGKIPMQKKKKLDGFITLFIFRSETVSSVSATGLMKAC